MDLDRTSIEQLVRKVIMEHFNGDANLKCVDKSGIISLKVPQMQVTEEDRLDTGNPSDIVYCKDLVSLDESPRLGIGLMVMKNTTFDWQLEYDEVDYIIEGRLDVIIDGRTISANSGEIIFIPKGSSIKFSVADDARFIYVTYPANWKEQ